MKVLEHNYLGEVVSAKELHKCLGYSKPNWSKWLKVNIINNSALKLGEDYILRKEEYMYSETMDALLKIDTAILLVTSRGNGRVNYEVLMKELHEIKGEKVYIYQKKLEYDFGELLDICVPFVKFEREFVIQNYRVDFFDEENGIIIEYDELSHSNNVVQDDERERELLKDERVYNIFRVPQGKEKQVLKDINRFYMELCYEDLITKEAVSRIKKPHSNEIMKFREV